MTTGVTGTGHTQGRDEWVPVEAGRKLFAQVLDRRARPDSAPPTVVFEAGAAADRSMWALVQPLVAEFARSVVYDRAGLGRSHRSPSDPTLATMAADLNRVLDHFGPGPFVLVGHSAGGPIVRLAAAAGPDRIAGLVLVDPTDEAADLLFDTRFRRGERVLASVGVLLARLGLIRFGFGATLRAVPDDVRADLLAEAFTVSTMQTARAQARTFLDDLWTWRDDPPDTGAVPVTVISGANPGDGMTRTMRAAAIASHEVRVAASVHGRHVMARNSAHNVVITEPGIIVDEIRRLVTADDLDG